MVSHTVEEPRLGSPFMWDSLPARGVVLWLLGVGDVYFEIAGDRLGLSAQHGAVG